MAVESAGRLRERERSGTARRLGRPTAPRRRCGLIGGPEWVGRESIVSVPAQLRHTLSLSKEEQSAGGARWATAGRTVRDQGLADKDERTLLDRFDGPRDCSRHLGKRLQGSPAAQRDPGGRETR